MDLRELHPSTKIGKDSSYWCGIEVEGREKGKPTVFIAEKVEDIEELIIQLVAYAEQIFFTETFSDWVWYAEKVFPRIAYRALPVFISVLPQNVEGVLYQRRTWSAYKHASLLVRVFGASWLNRLEPHDQISVGVPYDLVTFTIDQGVVTKPHEYEEDFT